MQTIIRIIISFIAGSFIQINTNVNNEDFYSIYSIPAQFIIYCMVYSLLYIRHTHCNVMYSDGNKSLNSQNFHIRDILHMIVSEMCGGTREGLISAFFGVLISISYIWGSNLELYNDIFAGTYVLLKITLKIIGTSVAASALWQILLHYYAGSNIVTIKAIRLSSRKLLCLVASVLLLFWIPVIVREWPGILYGDSYNEIYQAMGIENLTTHHPLCHILFIRFCLLLAGQNTNLAIAIYSVCSVMVVIILLAGVLTYMLKKQFNILAVSLLFVLCISPTTIFLSISILKDVLFAAFFVAYITCLYDILLSPLFCDKTKIIALLIVTIGLALTRKNGIYIVFLTTIIYCIYLLFSGRSMQAQRKKSLRLIIITGICVVILNSFIEGFFANNIVHARGGDYKEALSMPIQQLARLCKNVDISLDEREEINNFFIPGEGEDIGEYYYPLISDSAKGVFDNSYYEEHKYEFFCLSARMFMKYPLESIEGILNTCYGYWYPTRINWFYAYNKDDVDFSDILKSHEIPYPETVTFEYFNGIKYLPGASILLSIGTAVWVLLFLLSAALYSKQTSIKLLLIPVAILWLTCVASPVWNELRYALGLFWVIPFFLKNKKL